MPQQAAKSTEGDRTTTETIITALKETVAGLWPYPLGPIGVIAGGLVG